MAGKSSSMAELESLHKLITKSYTNRIEQDLADNIPTDAATLSGAVKFLKDNNVSADPATNDDLGELRAKLTEAAAKRRSKVSNVLALVKDDLLEATG
jgi:hypothetical protein